MSRAPRAGKWGRDRVVVVAVEPVTSGNLPYPRPGEIHSCGDITVQGAGLEHCDHALVWRGWTR